MEKWIKGKNNFLLLIIYYYHINELKIINIIMIHNNVEVRSIRLYNWCHAGTQESH